MNANVNSSDLLQSLLDGSLDDAGLREAMHLLETDESARRQFAELAQLQLWLAGDSGMAQAASAAPSRRVIRHPGWWLAAAVAAAIAIIAVSRLWSAPGAFSPSEVRVGIRPILAAACMQCHEQVERFLTAAAEFGQGRPGDPAASPLWQRLSGDNACAHSLPAADRAAIFWWIQAGAPLAAVDFGA